MQDMFSEANQHASKVREIYDAYVRAGFTAAQALELLKIVLRTPLH